MGIGKPRVERATGAAAIATSVTVDKPSQLDSVRLHMDAVGGASENFTVTINSAAADVYDTLIFSQDMTAVQDICWNPDPPISIMFNDVIDVAYNNGNARTYGLEVIYEPEY